MSEQAQKPLLVLQTGLFPDAETLEAAIKRRMQETDVRRYDLTQPDLDDAAWNQIVADIVSAGEIITI